MAGLLFYLKGYSVNTADYPQLKREEVVL